MPLLGFPYISCAGYVVYRARSTLIETVFDLEHHKLSTDDIVNSPAL